jgi:hypothetical protein
MMNGSGHYEVGLLQQEDPGADSSYLGLKGVVPPPSNNDRQNYSYL